MLGALHSRLLHAYVAWCLFDFQIADLMRSKFVRGLEL